MVNHGLGTCIFLVPIFLVATDLFLDSLLTEARCCVVPNKVAFFASNPLVWAELKVVVFDITAMPTSMVWKWFM